MTTTTANEPEWLVIYESLRTHLNPNWPLPIDRAQLTDLILKDLHAHGPLLPPDVGTAHLEGWQQTFTGSRFYPLQPTREPIHLADIAHALANQGRFTGHARSFYSVAQHCVLVSQHVPAADALWGLLHDAPEAYLVDVARPVKRSPALAGYRQAEARLMSAICDRFRLPHEEPVTVKRADRIALRTEQRDLVAPAHLCGDNRDDAEPWPERVVPWLPEVAEAMWLDRFHALTGDGSNELREATFRLWALEEEITHLLEGGRVRLLNLSRSTSPQPSTWAGTNPTKTTTEAA